MVKTCLCAARSRGVQKVFWEGVCLFRPFGQVPNRTALCRLHAWKICGINTSRFWALFFTLILHLFDTKRPCLDRSWVCFARPSFTQNLLEKTTTNRWMFLAILAHPSLWFQNMFARPSTLKTNLNISCSQTILLIILIYTSRSQNIPHQQRMFCHLLLCLRQKVAEKQYMFLHAWSPTHPTYIFLKLCSSTSLTSKLKYKICLHI
jgi:hypothetical protein